MILLLGITGEYFEKLKMYLDRRVQFKLRCITFLLLSCHQTTFFHLSTHLHAFSLKFRRSSKVQGCESNGHCYIMLGGLRSLATLACCDSVEILPSLTLLLATCNTSA